MKNSPGTRMKSMDNGSGVSELLGALALIGIIALVLAIVIAGPLGHPSSVKVPQVRFSIVNTTPVSETSPGNYSILITHEGGDEIPSGEYAVFIDGVRSNNLAINTYPDSTWNVGRTITVNTSSPPGLVSVYYVGSDSPTLLGQRVIGNLTNPIPGSTYRITASAGPHGGISPSGSIIVNYGDSKTFLITPETNYTIADVRVNGISVGAVPSFTFPPVTADQTITATFVISSYPIIASAGTGGTISPSGTVNVNYGGSQTFTITPQPGYNIANVIVDGVSVGGVSTYTFTNVIASHTIAATFTSYPTYTINASTTTGGGTISPTGAVSVLQGNSQTFIITPQAGYNIADVKVDGSSMGPISSYTFNNVQANHTIVASFNIKTFTITANAVGSGSITPSGSVIVNYGINQTFTITPNTGYSVSSVTVDGVSQGSLNSYTFTNVVMDHTITATFVTTPVITATAGTGGSISPSGSVSVNYGSSQSFTITPSTGYSISDVKVDGVSQGAVTSYTFSNVVVNHAISATFSIRTFTITPSVSGGNGAINPSTIQIVNYGATPIFTFIPDTGYKVDTVMVDGTLVTPTGNSYTFPAITANHAIVVTFIKQTSQHGNNILLNSASNSGYLKSGTYFSARPSGGGQSTSYVKFQGYSPVYFGPDDTVKIVVSGDQYTGKIYMSDSVTTCNIYAIAYKNGNLINSGYIESIYIKDFKSYTSTLTYVYQGTGSMQFVVDGTTYIDWGNTGYHDITISNIDENSAGILNMDWKRGNAYIVCSGDYTMLS